MILYKSMYNAPPYIQTGRSHVILPPSEAGISWRRRITFSLARSTIAVQQLNHN
jgi:hypothetical protein